MMVVVMGVRFRIIGVVLILLLFVHFLILLVMQ